MTTPVELVGASSTRLTLSVTIDSGIGYVTDVQGAGPGVGIVVTPSAPLHLHYRDYGDVVRHRWLGSSSLNTSLFGVLETHEGGAVGGP
jgi:hypothetical protein